jgi:hypothetical protein
LLSFSDKNGSEWAEQWTSAGPWQEEARHRQRVAASTLETAEWVKRERAAAQEEARQQAAASTTQPAQKEAVERAKRLEQATQKKEEWRAVQASGVY